MAANNECISRSKNACLDRRNFLGRGDCWNYSRRRLAFLSAFFNSFSGLDASEAARLGVDIARGDPKRQMSE